MTSTEFGRLIKNIPLILYLLAVLSYPGDKTIDVIPDGSDLTVAPELVNFVHCQGTGYYLTYLPFVGLTSQGSKTSGCKLYAYMIIL